MHNKTKTSAISLASILFLAVLVVPSVYADESIVDVVTINVPVSCSMSATGTDSHTANVNNGQTTENIGTTNLKVICNDNSGYAIYAIGYTDDTYGKTVLTSSTLGSTHDIATATTVTTGTSSWAMKLASVSGTYAPIIAGSTGDSLKQTGDPDFSDYTAVPSTYTKVAYYTSSTDTGTNATGSNLTTTYKAYISPSQPAGTYVGQVKYTLVHPNMNDDYNKPVAPLTANDCEAGYVCYAPNANDVIGSMSSLGSITSSPRAGKISVGTDATEIDLIAPNFKREGYGFAGWSTDFTATNESTIYGPNETITVANLLANENITFSSQGLILYPVWVASAGNLQGWTGCSDTSLAQATYDSTNNKIVATLSSVTALTDTRDGNVYAVAKLADGKCWMIENLRLDNTATISTSNTHNPLNTSGVVNLKIDYANNTVANHLSSTSDSWCSQIQASCIDQTMLNTNNTNLGGKNTLNADLVTTPGYPINSGADGKYGDAFSWYSYGNLYNWYSATAGKGTFSVNNSSVANGDICPNGWELPRGSSQNTSGSFYYLNQQMGKNDSAQGSMEFRMFPNNFAFSGNWSVSSAYNRGYYGFYWSSTSYSNNRYALNLYFSNNTLYTTDHRDKIGGYAVRCVTGA